MTQTGFQLEKTSVSQSLTGQIYFQKVGQGCKYFRQLRGKDNLIRGQHELYLAVRGHAFPIIYSRSTFSEQRIAVLLKAAAYVAQTKFA